MQYRSQCHQDQVVHQVFYPDKKDGTYLDIGAACGVAISNTKFFDDMGWKGMCIDPHYDHYKSLVYNRPRAINIFGAAYTYDGTVPFRMNTGYTQMLSGIETEYCDKHLDRISSEIESRGGTTQLTVVPCFNTTHLLETYGLTNIDYMSLDVEGAEMSILKSIDFTKIKVGVMTIEDNYGDDGIYNEYLSQYGYVKYAPIGHDVLYYLPSYVQPRSG